MPSEHALQLCTAQETVTKALAAEPHRKVSDVSKQVFGHFNIPVVTARLGAEKKDELKRAEQSGKFPHRPSDLFLKVRTLGIGIYCAP
jgi:hypothetical protein